MKHTLKTFPTPTPGYESYDRLQKWIDEAVAWHNEFERELREKLTEERSNWENAKAITEPNRERSGMMAFFNGRFKLLKEILEEDK